MSTASTNSILTALERLPLETRTEMAENVRGLTEHPGWAVFSKLLDDLVLSQRTINDRPGVREHTEYVAEHYGLQGLLRAQAIAPAVIESGDRANDMLRQTVAAMEPA